MKGADEKLQKVLRIFCNQIFEAQVPYVGKYLQLISVWVKEMMNYGISGTVEACI